MPAPRGQAGEEFRRVLERDDCRYQVLSDRGAIRAQEVDRLGGEPLPVPAVRQAPWLTAAAGLRLIRQRDIVYSISCSASIPSARRRQILHVRR